MLFIRAPSPGSLEQSWFDAPFFIGRVQMITLDRLDQQLAEWRDKLLSLPSIEDWRTLSLEATNVALWDWKPQNGVIRLSPAWGRLLGIDQTNRAVKLSEYVQYVHPDDRPLLTLTMVGFVVAGGEYASRHRMLHRNGSQRRFLSRDVAVLPEHGHPAHVVVADFDVTGASC